MRMTAMLGYARVSTIGQDLDAQLAALDAAGVDPSRVFTDKLSGSAKTARPGLVALLDYARPGDTVVVAAIDRLGRSVAGGHPHHRRSRRTANHVACRTRRRRYGHTNRASYRGHHGQRRRTGARTGPRAPRRIPRIPSRPASAGHQTPEAQPRTARTVAPACCDRGACASTGRSVRNRTSNCIPLSLLFPNLRAPEWLLASARLMRSR